jgi:UDP-3-O-[3-hydroxymyristoyl] glucosamine N-acyltransferase
VAIVLAELAVRYGCELHGDPDLEVVSVATLAEAQAGAIAFLANPGYKKFLADTQATAVILNKAAAEDCKVACLVTDNPYAVYAGIAAELHPQPALVPGIHPQAVVGEGTRVPDSCEISAGVVIGRDVRLGERVYIGPNCVIGDGSLLGSDTRLIANVSIYHDVHLGERCMVHAGTVIGSDGFGIAQSAQGWLKVPQLGGVRIGDDVEIGATCTIDRGAIDDTEIAAGVKLDNQVHIAHNVVIGEHTAIAGQCGISGSSRIGARCVMGGQVAISGHLVIADDVFLMGRSIVTKSIANSGTYSSVLSVEEAGKWRKLAARFKRLESMAARLKLLERKMNSSMDGKS